MKLFQQIHLARFHYTAKQQQSARHVHSSKPTNSLIHTTNKTLYAISNCVAPVPRLMSVHKLIQTQLHKSLTLLQHGGARSHVMQQIGSHFVLRFGVNG